MKTTKEERSVLRIVARTRDSQTYRAEFNVILQLLDDLDTLEMRFSEATALLERAEIYIETTTSRSQRVRDIRNTLLADLEKFTKTPDPRTEEQG